MIEEQESTPTPVVFAAQQLKLDHFLITQEELYRIEYRSHEVAHSEGQSDQLMLASLTLLGLSDTLELLPLQVAHQHHECEGDVVHDGEVHYTIWGDGG